MRCSRSAVSITLGSLIALAIAAAPQSAAAQPRPGKSAADKGAKAGVEDAKKAAAVDAAKDAPASKPDGSAAPATTGGSANAGQKLRVDYVVAVINDSVILSSELSLRSIPAVGEAQQIADPKERDRRVAKLTSQVLDEMINEELMVQAAEAAKIDVESGEVQAAVDDVKQQNHFADDAAFSAALTSQGFTLTSFKQEMRRQLLRYRAVNQLVSPKVQITDEDIRARYDQMARRTEQVSAVKLAHMLFKLPDHATEQQIAAAKDRASQALARVKAGEDFAKVAADVSDDDSTKATGGELGWFQRGSMANPDWEPVVFTMDKGDVRGPIVGPSGFHVFMVSETKRSDLKPFTEMKEQLSRELRRREMDKQTQAWVEDLRKKAYIDIKL